MLSCLWFGGGWAVCAGFWGYFSFDLAFVLVFVCLFVFLFFFVVSFSTINKVVAGEKL